MKVFITGGAGYIGSATANYLIENGHEVTIFDSLSKGHLAAVPKQAKFIQGYLGNREELTAALTSDKFDAVMHFAAHTEAGESMKDPSSFFENNVVNSSILIDEVFKAGIPKFVLSSTAAIFQSNDEPINEQSPIDPQNFYGYTKLMIEQTLEWYRKLKGLRYACLRYFNAAGGYPNRGEAHSPESHLIPLVLQVALGQREKIMIYGTDYPTPDGTCIRDYIHIQDLAQAHLLALKGLDNTDHLTYNLGNGEGYSVREIIETAREVTGHPIPAEEAPRRPGDAPRLIASSDKIKQDLGWEPKIGDIKEIIASAWEWHSSHPHGYAD